MTRRFGVPPPGREGTMDDNRAHRRRSRRCRPRVLRPNTSPARIDSMIAGVPPPSDVPRGPEVACSNGRSQRHGAAARQRRHGVLHQARLDDGRPGEPGPPTSLWGEMKTTSSYATWRVEAAVLGGGGGRRDRRCRGRQQRSPRTKRAGAMEQHDHGAMSDRMPVTFDAAEKSRCAADGRRSARARRRDERGRRGRQRPRGSRRRRRSTRARAARWNGARTAR